jgi:FkbM family methyltransferase
MEFKVELRNPYKLKGNFPFWLKIYCLYPNATRSNILRSSFRILFHLIRAYGFSRIQSGDHKFFPIYFEGSMKFKARDTNSQFSSVYFKEYAQVYEPDVSSVIQFFLKKGDVFADIGANWGHYSFQVILEKGIDVLAFEPSSLVAEDIRRIAHDLDVEENIQIFECGLSEKEGTVELIQGYFETGVASIEQNVFEDRKKGTISKLHRLFNLPPIKQLVKVRSFDSFKFEKLDFMKIDAEGAEISILKGARDSIKKFKPFICFEFHSGNLEGLSEFSHFFSELDYVMHEIKVDKDKSINSKFEVSLIPLKKEGMKKYTQHNILACHSSKIVP